jgi:cyclin-dependent kinase 12/13
VLKEEETTTAMGCSFAKQRPLPNEDLKASPKEKKVAALPVSTIKVETTAEPVFVVEKEKDRVVKVRSKQNGNSQAVLEEARERRRERREQGGGGEARHRPSNHVPKNLDGAQVVAGWPAWLSAVAGEAIKGWIPRHATSFEKLDKVSFF